MFIDERHAIALRLATTAGAAGRDCPQTRKELTDDEIGSGFEQRAVDGEGRMHVEPLTALRAWLAVIVQTGVAVTDVNHVVEFVVDKRSEPVAQAGELAGKVLQRLAGRSRGGETGRGAEYSELRRRPVEHDVGDQSGKSDVVGPEVRSIRSRFLLLLPRCAAPMICCKVSSWPLTNRAQFAGRTMQSLSRASSSPSMPFAMVAPEHPSGMYVTAIGTRSQELGRHGSDSCTATGGMPHPSRPRVA